MTNINSNGFTKSSRGSDTWTDSLTGGELSSRSPSAPAHSAHTTSNKRFAEHLAAPASKPEAVIQAPAKPAAFQAARSASAPKASSLPSEPSLPAQTRKQRPRAQDGEPAQITQNNAPVIRRPEPERPFSGTAPRPNTAGPADNPAKGGPSVKANRDLPAPTASAAASSGSVKAEAEGPAGTAAAVPGMPTANPADPTIESKPESAEDWRQRLQAMLSGGGPELFMQQSPALALLTGHLEFVDPARIPSIVAQDPLLQSILSRPQTADVLQTALPVEENLQLLGLAPSSLEAKNTGSPLPLMTSDPDGAAGGPAVTLAETLGALGFDPKRILQEGDLLRQNLDLEGLQSYMERAERMQSTLGLPVAWPTLPATPSDVSTALKAPAPTLATGPDLVAQLSRLAPEPTREPVQLWTRNPENDALMPLTVLDDDGAPVFLNPIENSGVNPDPFGMSPLESKSGTELPAPPAIDDVPLIMHTMPGAPSAELDPFLAITQRWNADTLQTLRSGNVPPRELMESEVESMAASQPLRSLDELLSSRLIQAPDFGGRMDDGSSPSIQSSASIDLNMPTAALQDPGFVRDEQGGDLSGRNPDQSFMNQDGGSPFTSTQPSAPSTQAFSVETAAAPQAPSAPVSPKQMQDILDNSTMLIKEGGGSIRLDLGSSEMGPLDLALDIKDKTVELRIVTHSDQAREALVQELPKLRESLQNQNLNLEKVEIGLSYNSAWSQSSGNGQQNREQFFETTSESGTRGPNGIRGTTRSYRQSFVSAPETRIPLHNGLIQVRV